MPATATLVISGACGRMGQTIGRSALQAPGVTVGGAFEVAGHAMIGHDYGSVLGLSGRLGIPVLDDPKAAMARGNVVIEFTLPEPTLAHVAAAKTLKKPMVIGTTGFSEAQLSKIRAAAKAIPIVLSPNMSLGVNLLLLLARTAAERLGLDYDVEVIEAHHRHKKDAPSGTAKRLAEVLAEARHQPLKTIPVHAVRAGDIVGDHTVLLAGPAERIELTHRAHSREVFARGALVAAQFVIGRRPGLYDMADVLNKVGTGTT